MIEERRLIEVAERHTFGSPAALASLLPEGLPPGFTTADLAAALPCHRRLAQQMTYCLRETGVIGMVGKEGNAIVYSRL